MELLEVFENHSLFFLHRIINLHSEILKKLDLKFLSSRFYDNLDFLIRYHMGLAIVPENKKINNGKNIMS